MPRREMTLRQLLRSGQPDSALVRITSREPLAPEDELLRALYGGLISHYTGAYEGSTHSLERAVDLAEDRYTKRISRATLSLVSSDLVLPYEPSLTERALIHYYAALNFLRRDDLEGAVVEARRLASLLERDSDPLERELEGWLRYFTGAIFEAAGERNDADVAYRNAGQILGSSLEFGGSVRADSGEVILLIEGGFIAHRVEQAVVIPIYNFEMDRLSRGESGERLRAAGSVTARVLATALAGGGKGGDLIYYGTNPRTLQVDPLPRSVVERECVQSSGRRRDQREARRRCREVRTPYLLKIAWPVYRQDEGGQRWVRVIDGPREVVQLRADLTRGVLNDFEGERGGILARTILRAATKVTVTRKLEGSSEEDSGRLGRILGTVFNLGSAVLEQADTRSWQLLPDQIQLLRLRLPAGEHQLAVELGVGSFGRRLEIGRVSVEGGSLAFISTRVWD